VYRQTHKIVRKLLEALEPAFRGAVLERIMNTLPVSETGQSGVKAGHVATRAFRGRRVEKADARQFARVLRPREWKGRARQQCQQKIATSDHWVMPLAQRAVALRDVSAVPIWRHCVGHAKRLRNYRFLFRGIDGLFSQDGDKGADRHVVSG
jgi:hypothetical protein